MSIPADDLARSRRAAHWIAGELLDTWEDMLGECSEYTELSRDEQGHMRLLLTRWADRHMSKSVATDAREGEP